MLYSSITQSSEQRKSSFPGGEEGTPQLEQLQEAINRAREDMKRNPSDQNTAEYSKAKAEFTQRKTPTDKETVVWKDCLPKPGEGLKQTLEPYQSLKWRGSILQQDCPLCP